MTDPSLSFRTLLMNVGWDGLAHWEPLRGH